MHKILVRKMKVCCKHIFSVEIRDVAGDNIGTSHNMSSRHLLVDSCDTVLFLTCFTFELDPTLDPPKGLLELPANHALIVI